MGLESGRYIEDLVVSNPLGTDGKAQGDNHLRLIKQVLKNQFPSLGAEAVTGTAEELNKAVAGRNPEGVISMWAGTTAQVPTGWQLCNGIGTTNNLNIAVPNLTGKFIVGSITDTGGTYSIGDTGGSVDITGSTASHTLTVAEIPAHTHDSRYSNTTPEHIDSFGNTEVGGWGTTRTFPTSSTGGGGGHSHDVSLSNKNLPPYYALAYIIYLG